MQIQTLIQYVAAVGAVLGGLDWIFGNRFGAGQKFEDGFRLMGTLAFSMTGIMMMAPVVVAVLRPMITPICHFLRLDTAGIAALLCVDMGGYPLAMQLAEDGAVGQFVGVVLTSTLGCTLSFTIPVGFGMVSKENQPFFVQGLLAGLMTLPIGAILGGMVTRLSIRAMLWNLLPTAVFAFLLAIGLLRMEDCVLRCICGFAKGVLALGVVGNSVGLLQILTGWTVLPNLTPIDEVFALVTTVTMTLIGILPAIHLLELVLRKPLQRMSEALRLKPFDMTGFLLSTASAVPVFAMMQEMSSRGVVLNTAWMVCACSMFGSQMGFVSTADPAMLSAFLLTKGGGSIVALVVADVLFRKKNPPKP